MKSALEILLVISVFLLFYPIVIYPALLWLIGKLAKNPVLKKEGYTPGITFIVAAYNEADLIEDCINSILQSDYPKEKINIIAGSDGSTDSTLALLKKLALSHSGIKVYEFSRAGKNRMINELYPLVETELIGFLDADCRLDKKAIHNAVENLSDLSVGMTISKVQIMMDDNDPGSGAAGESFYQNYESFLRRKETSIASNINGLGSFLALRRELMNKLPNDKVCDDFFIILNCIENGKRVIYDDEIVTYEVRGKNLKAEASRRVRLVSGGLATISNKKALLSPSRGWIAFFLWSHKTLRWFIPFYIIMIITFSATLSINHESYLWIPLTLVALFLLSFAGAMFEKAGVNIRLLKLIVFFSVMNIGFIRGIFRFFKGGQNAVWDRSGLKNP